MDTSEQSDREMRWHLHMLIWTCWLTVACGVAGRLKVDFRVPRSCVKWYIKECHTRYVLRSGCVLPEHWRRNLSLKWAIKSSSKPALTTTWWLPNKLKRSAVHMGFAYSEWVLLFLYEAEYNCTYLCINAVCNEQWICVATYKCDTSMAVIFWDVDILAMLSVKWVVWGNVSLIAGILSVGKGMVSSV